MFLVPRFFARKNWWGEAQTLMVSRHAALWGNMRNIDYNLPGISEIQHRKQEHDMSFSKCRDFNASVSQIACNMSTMMWVCSVQLAEERRGRRGRMGDNLWSGLGEMFGFSWHLHFHYPGLYDLLCFTLRINQIPNMPNILSLCVWILS